MTTVIVFLLGFGFGYIAKSMIDKKSSTKKTTGGGGGMNQPDGNDIDQKSY